MLEPIEQNEGRAQPGQERARRREAGKCKRRRGEWGGTATPHVATATPQRSGRSIALLPTTQMPMGTERAISSSAATCASNRTPAPRLLLMAKALQHHQARPRRARSRAARRRTAQAGADKTTKENTRATRLNSGPQAQGVDCPAGANARSTSLHAASSQQAQAAPAAPRGPQPLTPLPRLARPRSLPQPRDKLASRPLPSSPPPQAGKQWKLGRSGDGPSRDERDQELLTREAEEASGGAQSTRASRVARRSAGPGRPGADAVAAGKRKAGLGESLRPGPGQSRRRQAVRS
mmetsp:Transcript_3093/g.12739  ORF Transcript_3093/g.12739 Transcript_3093/m.12739 type:complete len:292 (-) Transcript_3093:1571-2446(-)